MGKFSDAVTPVGDLSLYLLYVQCIFVQVAVVRLMCLFNQWTPSLMTCLTETVHSHANINTEGKGNTGRRNNQKNFAI